ncbi:MAG: tripartite motif-containing protein 71 [Gaiellales bacterium]|nr:tripartite motif-containing protein 71 [Gaiellales bacterium]
MGTRRWTNRAPVAGVSARIAVGIFLAAVLMAASGPSTAEAAAPAYLRTIGGPGHATMYPSGLDIDALGTVYVADTGNDQVAAYRADGTQIWRTGTHGPRALGRFNNPRDIAVLGGRVYVDDTGYNRIQVLDAATGAPLSAWPFRFGSTLGVSAGVDGAGLPVILVTEDINNRILVFTPTGVLLRTIASEIGSGLGQMNAPRDAATDSAGNIYVADYNNNRVAKFSPIGVPLPGWGTRGSATGQFIRPYGIDVDASNRVYVADSANGRIQQFAGTGTYLRKYGSNGTGPLQFFQLRRVAVGAGTVPAVYGADLWGAKVLQFRQPGAYQRTYGGGTGADGSFNEPSGLAVDGQLFVTDSVNQRVQRFDTATGAWQLSFGHRGWGKLDLLGFNWPRDLTVDHATDTLWVADTKNSRLTQFTRQGLATGRFLGAVGTGTEQLHWPFGIVATGGDLIVADTVNNRIQRWDLATGTTIWTQTGFSSPKDVAVAGGTVYVADTIANRVVKLNAATGAVTGSFGGLHQPEGIALDATGGIWVADTGTNRIVKLSSAGIQLVAFGQLGAEHGTFNLPGHLEISGAQLFIADTFNDRIEVYSIG